MEDPVTGVIQILTDKNVFIWSIVIIFSILFFNLNGLTLTKHVSCVFRAFWDATRTASVWVRIRDLMSLGVESYSRP